MTKLVRTLFLLGLLSCRARLSLELLGGGTGEAGGHQEETAHLI